MQVEPQEEKQNEQVWSGNTVGIQAETPLNCDDEDQNEDDKTENIESTKSKNENIGVNLVNDNISIEIKSRNTSPIIDNFAPGRTLPRDNLLCLKCFYACFVNSNSRLTKYDGTPIEIRPDSNLGTMLPVTINDEIDLKDQKQISPQKPISETDRIDYIKSSTEANAKFAKLLQKTKSDPLNTHNLLNPKYFKKLQVKDLMLGKLDKPF